MGKNLELKSVREILDKDFLIPSYQRGYRWGEQQVTDLLNDILEFSQNKTKEEFYPLQPIVVFNNENVYEIIDGQQRITTIYIIFKYLRDLTELFETNKEEINKLNDIFGFCLGNIGGIKNAINLKTEIKYQTRVGSEEFLQNSIKDESNEQRLANPDFYYMSSAYQTIKKWFHERSVHLDLFVDTLLNQTQVIWYEINAKNEKEKTDIFTRLNIGKIELTNAELIKALLLQDESEYKKQIELGNELDKIEYSLRNDKFWYFIASNNKATRIDLIFELLADIYKEKFNDSYLKNIDKKYDDKYSFYIFEYLLKNSDRTRENIFSQLKDYYRYLEEWYSDKEFYHKVGYLLTIQKKITLQHFIKTYEDKEIDKDGYRRYLDTQIKNQLKNVKISKLQYGDKQIKNILLLFNVETILNNENISYQFDFHKYKTGSWDIEHIRSQTDADITGNAREDWIKTLLEVYGKQESKIKTAQEKYKDDNKFEIFYKRISKKLGENKTFNETLKDSIGNLALLDSKTNRGYGNAFFPIKRAIILDVDIKGRFIPICTKNVFLKVYSNTIKNMMSWDENDIKSHRCKIHKTLKKYLGLKSGK